MGDGLSAMSKKRRRRIRAVKQKPIRIEDGNFQQSIISRRLSSNPFREAFRGMFSAGVAWLAASQVANAETILGYLENGSTLKQIAGVIRFVFAGLWFGIGTSGLLLAAIFFPVAERMSKYVVLQLAKKRSIHADDNWPFTPFELASIGRISKLLLVLSSLAMSLGVLTLLTTAGFQDRLVLFITQTLPKTGEKIARAISDIVTFFTSGIAGLFTAVALNIVASIIYDVAIKSRIEKWIQKQKKKISW